LTGGHKPRLALWNWAFFFRLVAHNFSLNNIILVFSCSGERCVIASS
jgi:hypothetical protein